MPSCATSASARAPRPHSNRERTDAASATASEALLLPSLHLPRHLPRTPALPVAETRWRAARPATVFRTAERPTARSSSRVSASAAMIVLATAASRARTGLKGPARRRAPPSGGVTFSSARLCELFEA